MKRTRHKKMFPSLLAFIIPVMMLGTFNLYAGGNKEDTPEAEEVSVVRLVSERGSHTEAWKTQMEGFEAATGIDLEITQHPYANYFDQLMLNFTGGQAGFDVPYISMLWYPTLATAGYIQPLNELVEKNPNLTEDMPGLMKSSIEGNLYFIPYMNEVGGVVYRTDLFNDPEEQKNFKAKYGYELAPPKTLEQYVDLAEFFHRPPDLYGVTLMGKKSIFLATHFMNRLWARGGDLLDADMKPIFDNVIGVQALQEAVDMFRYAGSAALSYDFQEALTEFKLGKSAMAELWTTAMFHVNDPASSQVVNKASFVGFPKPADAVNEKRPRLYISWGFALSSDAVNKEAALQWIEYVIGEKQLAEASPLGTVPARLSALEDQDLINALPWLKPFQEALGDCIPTPMVPLIPEGNTIVNQFIAPAVSECLTGNMTAEEALRDAAKKTYDLLKENGYYD
ncbi:MAG: extracellular solute-binding protein [Spirochaetales bacterium]|nr:extracellular solute-binding protein [Spirochaetales bacterium]